MWTCACVWGRAGRAEGFRGQDMLCSQMHLLHGTSHTHTDAAAAMKQPGPSLTPPPPFHVCLQIGISNTSQVNGVLPANAPRKVSSPSRTSCMDQSVATSCKDPFCHSHSTFLGRCSHQWQVSGWGVGDCVLKLGEIGILQGVSGIAAPPDGLPPLPHPTPLPHPAPTASPCPLGG